MSETADRSRATQASEWFTVMTRDSVTPEDLAAFRAWRRDPANAEAFAKVKAGWTAAGTLGGRPAIAAATAEALAKYPDQATFEQPSRRFRLAPLALGAAGLAGVAGAFLVWRAAEPQYATPVGGQRVVVLADGSRVRLDTDSRLRIAFRSGQRRVVLARGQAFFDVAHDPAHPFVVVADGAEVQALGTRFDVRRDGGRVRVTLLQGRVQVRAGGGGQAVLTPGQAVVADARGLSAPTATDAAAATSWTTGRITFSGVPLREAVAEVNRYSRRKVVLETPGAAAGDLVSGQFVAGDVPSFVAAARSLYGLKVTGETDDEIRLGAGG